MTVPTVLLDPCPICSSGDTRVDDCITVSEHIPGCTGPDGLFPFKAHRQCVFEAIESNTLANYLPEPK